MRYYLITRENLESSPEHPKNIYGAVDPFGSTREERIISIQPISDKFSIQMINILLRSVSQELKLNNLDKVALDTKGLSLVYQYPKNQIWIYDIEHPDNNFLKIIIRDSKINKILDENAKSKFILY